MLSEGGNTRNNFMGENEVEDTDREEMVKKKKRPKRHGKG